MTTQYTRRWNRRARNRRAMWRVIGWAVWVAAMFGLLIVWSALMGTS